MATDDAVKAAPVAAQKITETQLALHPLAKPLFWLLVGAILFVVFYVIIEYLRKRWKK